MHGLHRSITGRRGTRLKILEAMALGRPVVSTTLGCEGLEVTDKEHLLVADTPRQFADATIRLLVDEPLRQQITMQARQAVTSHYDWDIIAEKLMQIYDEMVQ
jgi:glycosyltransferase involved in cell wall biosynthesis